MRKLIVLLILVIFSIYCVLANRCQTWYDLPEYEYTTIDILDGMTAEEWAELPELVQRDRFATLSGRRLQIVKPLIAGNTFLLDDQVLDANDYSTFQASGINAIEVRDPASIFSFINLRLTLRQDVKLTDSETVIGAGGLRINKEFLDSYIAAAKDGNLAQEPGHEGQVAVVGNGQVVGFNASLIMVILIFVGMALVMEQIFWKPMMAFIDERTGEIRKGAECLRSNRTEAERIDQEYRKSLRQLNKECHQRLREERQNTFEHADLIVSKAWGEMKEMRSSAQEEINEAVVKAEKKLREEIPAMAEAISNQIKKTS